MRLDEQRAITEGEEILLSLTDTCVCDPVRNLSRLTGSSSSPWLEWLFNSCWSLSGVKGCWLTSSQEKSYNRHGPQLDQDQADSRAAWGMRGPHVGNNIKAQAGVRRPMRNGWVEATWPCAIWIILWVDL